MRSRWDGPRFYVEDPFGNRLELLAPHADLHVRALRDDERAWAAGVVERQLGRLVIGGGREHRPAELPALVAEADGERAGLAHLPIEDAPASSSRSTRSPSAAASAARWSRASPTPPARPAAPAFT